MKNIALLLLLVLGFGLGCSRSVPPPTPLTVQELPSALEKAFASAQPDAKALVNQVISCVKTERYSEAFAALQTLERAPGLTKEQLSTLARATLTVNELLHAAQAKGDAKAAQTLNLYRRNK
jgi:hypothetical protein